MKYPQLVSTRAVNAISDWLVSRLEQLGVEAPQIYTRFLLSLLQSSVQINDPNEFSDLETFFASRKGNNKRYLPSDTDTLKKLNAVQCLREIVSSEEEIATIENLVDELCEKLKDIEKQSTDVEDAENAIVATLSVTTANSSPSEQIPHQSQYEHQHNHTKHIHYCKHHSKEFQQEGLTSRVCSEITSDIEADPKKRYFRAFPALSKEMEDSFRIWRQNAKSLTWPVDRSNISISSSSSSSTISNTFVSERAGKLTVNAVGAKESLPMFEIAKNNSSDNFGSLSNCGDNAIESNNVGIKKKSKRKRNIAISRGRAIQNIRKNSTGNVASGSGGKHHRNPYWDTDFEGCWEMGRDLIKEFITKQNKNIRNRSTSESAADNMKYGATGEERSVNPPASLVAEQNNFINSNEENYLKGSSPPMQPIVDISFCDDDFEDTTASLSELANEEFSSSAFPRRLYQRDTKFGSRELLLSEEETSIDVQVDFAQFKAKFDSSIEALWKDADPVSPVGLPVDGFALASLPVVDPLKKNVDNYLSNYFTYHYKSKAIAKQYPPPGIPHKTDDSSASLSYSSSGSALNGEFMNTSEYYSMPSNLDDFEKSVGGTRRDYKEDHTCDSSDQISVFAKNSIWSEKSGVDVGDANDAFYFNVWNSSKKLNQAENILKEKVSALGSVKPFESAFQFPPYNISKWSEGINAGPNKQLQRLQMENNRANNNNNKIFQNSVDSTDSATALSNCSSSYIHPSAAQNWPTPIIGQSLQADLQSWSSSNPTSLTELYGGSSDNINSMVCDDEKCKESNEYLEPSNENETGIPLVTLPNHSTVSSGFIEYSRVKYIDKANKNVRQHIYPPQILRPKEYYPDDENLLTSERTHFHPIKTYADGHTFDICGSLDTIEYDRSASGYFYLDADRYLEYTRSDNFLTEDDSVGSSVGASSAPLYATSNCEAAHAKAGEMGKKKFKREVEFVLKFRMRNCEIGCQTEYNAGLPRSIENMNNNFNLVGQHPLSLLFSEAAEDRNSLSPGLDAIAALNKAVAVAAAAEAVAVATAEMSWIPNVAMAGAVYQNSAVWAVAQSTYEDEKFCDEVDFGRTLTTGNESSCSGSGLEVEWSMREIGKNCQLKGHGNNNNNDEGGVHGSGTHTLWGMCAACNSEFKSIPANRLLRDELDLEADEIMSDLRYMQDLYIGRVEEDSVSGTDSEFEADRSELGGESTSTADFDLRFKELEKRRAQDKDEATCIDKDYLNLHANLHQPQTQEVMEKMNMLIANLLRTDNGTVNNSNYADQVSAAVIERQSRGGDRDGGDRDDALYSNNEVNNWQGSDISSSPLKPMDLIRHFNVESHSNALEGEEIKFLAQLSWEHGNLAEIWQKNTPAFEDNLENTQETEIEIDKSCVKENEAPKCSAVGTTAIDLTSPSGLASEHTKLQSNPNISTATQRVEHFLHSNVSSNGVSKIKLANRKRRHSASQNLFHLPPTSAATNNNNVEIADLNNFDLKLISSNLTVSGLAFSNDVDMQKFLSSSLRNKLNKDAPFRGYDKLYTDDEDTSQACGDGLKQPKQTIITCKYWTTIDPIMRETGEIVGDTTFSCLIDKNSTLLKHVAMGARPLTR